MIPAKYVIIIWSLVAASILQVDAGSSCSKPATTTQTEKHSSQLSLYDAIREQNLEMVANFLEEGADPNTTSDYTRSTPIIIAAYYKSVDIIRILLEKGADPNSTNRIGFTALKTAIECQNTEVIKLLLEKGADPNRVDRMGRIALHRAIELNNLEMVMILLKYKANLYIKDIRGYSSLLYAISCNSNLIKFLLDKGVNPNEQDKSDLTSLHHSVKKGDFETTKLLLLYGANPYIVDKYGKTALDYASDENTDLINLLLSHRFFYR